MTFFATIVVIDSDKNIEKSLEYIYKNTLGINYELIVITPFEHRLNLLKSLTIKNRKKTEIAFISQINKGAVINQFAHNSDSAYIVFVDSNVFVMPKWLRNLTACFADDSLAAFASPISNADLINASLDELIELSKENSKPNSAKWKKSCLINPPVSVLSVDKLNEIGGVDESLSGKYLFYDLCIRFNFFGYNNYVCADSFVFSEEMFVDNKSNREIFEQKYGKEMLPELKKTDIPILHNKQDGFNVLVVNETCKEAFDKISTLSEKQITCCCIRTESDFNDYCKISCECFIDNAESSHCGERRKKFGKPLLTKDVLKNSFNCIFLGGSINVYKNPDVIFDTFSKIISTDGIVHLNFKNYAHFNYLEKIFGINTGRVMNFNEPFEVLPKYDLKDILWLSSKNEFIAFNIESNVKRDLQPLLKRIRRYITDEQLISFLAESVQFEEILLTLRKNFRKF